MYGYGGPGYGVNLTDQFQKVGGNDCGFSRVRVRNCEERRAGGEKLGARAVPEHDVDSLEGVGNFAEAERSVAGHVVAERLKRNLERVADDERKGFARTHRDLDTADLWMVRRVECRGQHQGLTGELLRGRDDSP